MGLFKSKEEKELRKKEKAEEKAQKRSEKELKQQQNAVFIGENQQPIGKIPAGTGVNLTLKPDRQVLCIRQGDIEITLPYDRIRSFRVVDEVTLQKSGSGIGGAIVGGALFGSTGAIVGQNVKKGKTDKKWIGILSYTDKAGNPQELSFIQITITGYYSGDTKHYGAAQFESLVNKIAAENAEDITEL